MGGNSRKKAAKKATAEVKASYRAPIAAAAVRDNVSHNGAAPPLSEPDALVELVRLMQFHADDADNQSLVDEAHAHMMRSLGSVPNGQTLPDSYGEMGFYAITMLGAAQKGLCGAEAHAYLDEEVKKGRLEHAGATDQALRAHLAESNATPEYMSKLCLMLSHSADARIPVVQDVMTAEPKVHMGPAGSKGNGVFALHDIPAGVPFTIYPCHGLWVGGHQGRDHVGRFFVSPLIFPCWEGELNIGYAIDVPRLEGGPRVMAIGHHHHCTWFACGHIINDSHTVEDAGGPDAYLALANGNCEPRYADTGMGSIVMFTTRAVTKGDELLYNYGVARWTAPPRRCNKDSEQDLASRMRDSCKLYE